MVITLSVRASASTNFSVQDGQTVTGIIEITSLETVHVESTIFTTFTTTQTPILSNGDYNSNTICCDKNNEEDDEDNYDRYCYKR